MDANEAVAAIGDTAVAIGDTSVLNVTTVTPIHGGWASWTFQVGEEWIFRFPRTDEGGEAAAREIRLLPILAEAVDFAIPRPAWAGTWNGRPFFGYRKIAGRALHGGDDRPPTLQRLADMVAQLHRFDVDAASAALGIDDPGIAWTGRYRDLREVAGTRTEGILDPVDARLLAARFDGFLARGFGSSATLVHCDLGAEHLLVDDSGTPVGIIDFEDATVGDPAIDFVGFWITLGEDATRRLLERYRGPVDETFVDRIRDYWWLGSLHAVLHGLDEGDDGIVADGLVGLRRRLGSR